ncbi:transcription antitermination factor NusB [Elstera cyanobacteriorum]|uniref:transcription antitermination factor NusB n=1 Tax=Elstera cyanobacteriorum TaxID=2022747 RepID=UPI003081188B
MSDQSSGRRPPGKGGFGKRPGGAGGGKRPPGDRPFGPRPQGDRPQGDRPQGERRFGPRPEGDRPRGPRPQGDGPRGDGPRGERPFNNRPKADGVQGERRFGPRPEGDRPRGPRPEGDRPRGPRPEGDRPRGPRPQGDRLDGAPRRMKPGAAANPRVLAVDLIGQVLRGRRPLDDAFAGHPGLKPLDLRDRAFVRALTAAVLRHLGLIDAVIAKLVREPIKPRDAVAEDILRLGLAQLLILETPPHAAVSATVALTIELNMAHMTGFVNALLRRFIDEHETLLASIDRARAAVPAWLWKSWEATYGLETTQAIAAGLSGEAPLDLTLKDPATAAEWAEKLGAEILPTGSLRVQETHGRVDALLGFSQGVWWVQDAGAALPAKLLGNIAGQRVVDLCAAPGGKTMQLAAAGAKVTALDRSAQRLRRVTENLARVGLTAETVADDAAFYRAPRPFDAVLLDAPCSATGTARRHPDVLWLKQPGDIDTLIIAQDRLLDAAAKMISTGGTLVYCVCSLEPEEGPERIARFLARDRRFIRVPVRAAEVGGMAEFITPQGDLRTLPSHLADKGGIDGFYAARLRRVS